MIRVKPGMSGSRTILTRNTRSTPGDYPEMPFCLRLVPDRDMETQEDNYDAVWFLRQGDIGTAIINPQKFRLRTPTATK